MELNLSGVLENLQLSKGGMVLPFVPFSMSFEKVNYYVDMPKVSL